MTRFAVYYFVFFTSWAVITPFFQTFLDARGFDKPQVGLLLGAGLVALGVWLERSLRGSHEAPGIDRGLMWAFFCLGSAFLGFLFSRYALGMAKDPTWRLLRAGGGFMTVGEGMKKTLLDMPQRSATVR